MRSSSAHVDVSRGIRAVSLRGHLGAPSGGYTRAHAPGHALWLVQGVFRCHEQKGSRACGHPFSPFPDAGLTPALSSVQLDG